MSWKSGLRPASFRGASFHVRDRGLKGGRALAIHEYPKRNSPYPEDMGREARKWTVDAYVIGDDYMARRDALIAACEKPGPGSYADHWGRSGSVACESFEVKEQSEEGRMCRLSLTFVEASSASMPAAVVATAAVLAGAASGLGAAALAQFAGAGIVGQLPASLGAGMQTLGVPAGNAVQMVSGLSAGSSVAVGLALRSGLGVALSQSVPARIGGAVLQSATRLPLSVQLPR